MNLHCHDIRLWSTYGAVFLFIAYISALVYTVQTDKQRASSGYYGARRLQIFPMHGSLLVLLGVSFMAEGLLAAPWLWLWLGADGILTQLNCKYVMKGVTHLCTEGITALLLHPGIGWNSMKRSAGIGLVSGAFNGTLSYLSNRWADDTAGAEGGSAVAWHVVLAEDALRRAALVGAYTLLWRAPRRWLVKRPAAAYWIRFFAVYYAAKVGVFYLGRKLRHTLLMEVVHCLDYTVEVVFFTSIVNLAAYRTFVIDTQFWHGVPVDDDGCCCCGCCPAVDAWDSSRGRAPGGTGTNREALLGSSLGSGLGGGSPRDWASFDSAQHSQGTESAYRYASPLGGTELSEHSAVSLSQALDEGFGFGPAGVAFGAAVGVGAARRAVSGAKAMAPQRALSTAAGSSSTPLLDFSLLRIFTRRRMLGAGTSARVFQGSWRGTPVAVKVLYGLDITPSDIARLCTEAALLRRISSPNVVGLVGVSVLPPSLCVVLELCSEGSLADVLYGGGDFRRSFSRQYSSGLLEGIAEGLNRLSESFSSQSNASRGSHNRFSSLGGGSGDSKQGSQRSGRDGPRDTSSGPALPPLPWSTRLELMSGAAKGVEAFHAALPGYSHNDIKSTNFLVHRVPMRPGNNGAAEIGGGGGGSGGRWALVVKLADVEFASKGATPEHLTSDDLRVPLWTAPEVYAKRAPVSPESDVFSLGCVLFECAARAVPFGDLNRSAVAALLTEGALPVLPDATREATAAHPGRNHAAAVEAASRYQFAKLFARACSASPEARPTAGEVAAALDMARGLLREALQDAGAWDSGVARRATAGAAEASRSLGDLEHERWLRHRGTGSESDEEVH